MNEVLWTEQYRPDSLEDLAMSDEARSLVEKFLESGEIPHLLLVGPPGCGKTTVAGIITDRLDCSVKTLNASNERGIDTVREEIKNFARSSRAGWNIVFLDEADQLTRDAQQALRNMMERYSDQTRFILTGNHGHKIVDAIKSRCTSIPMARPPVKERMKILASILKAEGVEFDDPDVVFSYAESFEDMRKMINMAQKSILTHGELQPAKSIHVTGEDLFEAIYTENWTAVREFSQDPHFDHQQALRDLFHAIPDEFEKAPTWRATVGEAVHESGFTPDPVVHFLGTCAELMSTVS